MSTESWSSRIRHDSDAVWQEWRDDLHARIQNHLTLADTNIVAATGARAGTNAEGNYATYYLNDSMHGTAPLYIRVGYRTGGGVTSAGLSIRTGTSNSGGGTLGGTLSDTITLSASSVHTSDTSRQSLMSHADGFFGLMFKGGVTGVAWAVIICRSCDSSATPTAIGHILICHYNNGLTTQLYGDQMIRVATTAAAYTQRTTAANCAIAVNPHNRTTSGTPQQVAVAMMGLPTVLPIFGVVGVFTVSAVAEVAPYSTFSVQNVGASARTFITLPPECGSINGIDPDSTDGSLSIGMLWE